MTDSVPKCSVCGHPAHGLAMCGVRCGVAVFTYGPGETQEIEDLCECGAP